MSIKLLIGGSPCTYWSIAQTYNRETKTEGMGWELFKNYLIAKEKFKPDFFLYENNKSASQAIKDQIAKELGVGVDPMARFTYINSALVSAQNRQRFYVTNFGDIEQPEDRGILLKDILETGADLTQNRKSYCMTAGYNGAVAWNTIERSQRSMVAEPVNTTSDGKAVTLKAQYYKNGMANFLNDTSQGGKYSAAGVAEPVILNDINGKVGTIRATCYKDGIRNLVGNNVDKRTCVAEPIRVGSLPRPNGELSTSQGMRIYAQDGKSITQSAGGGGLGGKTGLYAIPVESEDGIPTKAVSCADGKTYTVYKVENGLITIKGKTYPIKLQDGYYIIRKRDCRRCPMITVKQCRIAKHIKLSAMVGLQRLLSTYSITHLKMFLVMRKSWCFLCTMVLLRVGIA